MPALDEHLHYRLVDVSSIKELVRRWFPRVYFNSPAKHGGHRALADIRESIEELKFYRQAVFVPQPGRTPTRSRRSPPSSCWPRTPDGGGPGRTCGPCMIHAPRRRCTWWV